MKSNNDSAPSWCRVALEKCRARIIITLITWLCLDSGYSNSVAYFSNGMMPRSWWRLASSPTIIVFIMAPLKTFFPLRWRRRRPRGAKKPIMHLAKKETETKTRDYKPIKILFIFTKNHQVHNFGSHAWILLFDIVPLLAFPNRTTIIKDEFGHFF